jgi:hypothetical protein
VSDGAVPIDIIRRPDPNNPDPQPVLDQRFFSMASLRILLSDTAADITSLPTVTAGDPIELGRLNDPAHRATIAGLAFPHPVASAAAFDADPAVGRGYGFPAGSPALTGFIKIERQRVNETWQDVTAEILSLGFTARSVARNATFNSVATRTRIPARMPSSGCSACVTTRAPASRRAASTRATGPR